MELSEIRSDAPVRPVKDPRPVWVHHGSSISHGSNAVHPTGTWPAVAAGKLTLAVIRAEPARIVTERAHDDPHLFHLDGRELYGESDARDLPLPDALHPDATTHLRIGRRFAELALSDGAPLAPARRPA